MQRSRSEKKVRRSSVLVDKPLQLKLTAWFAAVTVAAILLQYIFLVDAFSRLDTGSAGTGSFPSPDRLFDATARAALMAAVVAVPMMIVVAIVATFRISGPIYTMKRFLAAVARGEKPTDCRLRKGDELKELCDLVNEATRPLREGQGAGMESPGDELRASA